MSVDDWIQAITYWSLCCQSAPNNVSTVMRLVSVDKLYSNIKCLSKTGTDSTNQLFFSQNLLKIDFSLLKVALATLESISANMH